ncbi:hypothetical protein ARMSODRAFT_1007931 [Armillaria solidipes]|uniref:DUF6534 domain-containing protein n=1 Tax=Armillaria solidipes TaxID=1076256 RepID=A0A2H3B280_9AGAR|nr:hypothetical protein ARMSODRAFT_1007931 [Armillaria solidipes]
MSSQPPKVILGETLGALYVGATIAAVLFGITNLQAVIYYNKYPSDWILDTLHVALTTHAMYFYLVEMFGDLAGALVHSVWSFKVQLGINTLIVVYVQGLYAIRIWKRSCFYALVIVTDKASDTVGRHFHKFLPWFVFLAVAASLGIQVALLVSSGLANYASDSFRSRNLSITRNFSDIAAIKTSIYTIFATIAVTDFVIALMVCYYLHKSRAATKFSSTASLLLNLMRIIVVSGLATSACSLLTLISYIVWPQSLIFIAIDFILPKLYINSLLAMFNYRPEHLESNKSNAERAGHSTPAVLCITPQTFDGSNAETHFPQNVSIPLSDIQDIRFFEDKLDHSKGTLNYNQV